MTLGHERPRPMPDDWRSDAACSGMPPSIFVPAVKRQRTKLDEKAIAWARTICARCPVGEACEADGSTDHYAIRGGKLPEERNVIPKVHDPACGTTPGHRMHRQRGEDPCAPCLAAERAYRVEWRAKRREAMA